ncbi:MAG: hypothetical protein H6810_10370 [Phycisphaeraceae bacterium]|nr:MAG: hypothetical protein H6810_10370 [Phycisphaeraceae bacterium]
MRDGIDEYTLLCEKCGYVIEGLPREGACPECAKPVAESLPERREGTAWQRAPTWRSFVRTVVSTLRHPLGTIAVMQIDERSVRSFRWRALLVSGALIGLPLAVAAAPLVRGPVRPLFAFIVLPCATAGIAVLLAFLTLLECEGLCVLGRTKGARLTKAVAVTVTSFGCSGWIAGVSGTGLLLCACVPVTLLDMVWIDHGTHQSPGFSETGWDVLDAVAWVFWFPPILGFLFFEVFAWLGLRRCRFANRARPETEGSQGS